MKVAVCTFALLCFAPQFFAQSPELKTKFISCAQDAQGNDIGPNSMRTPIVVSASGWRAYGIVNANFKSGCSNTTLLFLAAPKGDFRQIYELGVEKTPGNNGSVYDGNGIARLDWSPGGHRLLVEIFQWTWGSDFGEGNKYLVLDEGGRPKRLFPEKAVRKLFESECGMLLNSAGWIDEHTIRMVGKPYENADDPGPSCIKAKVSFSFDILTGQAVRLKAK